MEEYTASSGPLRERSGSDRLFAGLVRPPFLTFSVAASQLGQCSFDGWFPGPNDIKVTVDESGQAKLDIVNKDFDFQNWISKNGADVRMPQVLECAKQLRNEYSWVGYAGYCWGGGVGFKVASKDHQGLFDSVTVAHSSSPSEEEVRSIGVPFQILDAEHDPTFPPEVKDMCNREIPKLVSFSLM